jgi:hypothetical protein
MEKWKKEMINDDMNRILSFLKEQLDILKKDDMEYSIDNKVPMDYVDSCKARRATSVIDTAVKDIDQIKEELNRFLQEQ